MPASKIDEYVAQRITGLPPLQAAITAGYAHAGISAVCNRLEAREDVRKAIRAASKGVGKSKQLRPLKSPTSKRQYRSVADEPRHGDGPDESTLSPWKLRDRYDSPLDLLKDVMNNPKAPGGLRIQCAKDALPYCHARKEGSKKEDDKTKAKSTASSSKFGSVPRPGLRLASAA